MVHVMTGVGVSRTEIQSALPAYTVTSAAGPVVGEIFIQTDGSLAEENRVRTVVANLAPNAIINTDRDPIDYQLETFFADLDRLALVASVFVLIIGGFGLTVSMIAGLIERRRPFALLRASGVRVSELRRSLFLETTATMVLTSAVGVAIGMLLGYLSSRQSDVDWRWPGLELLGGIGGAVLAAMAFSTLALPLLSRATRPDLIRFE
jgi:ABC-type antimicrobial peptide transport system permease subunit